MSPMVSINTTAEHEYYAFNILKQFITVSLPTDFKTIFGHHKQQSLPFPTAVPIRACCVNLTATNKGTLALMESLRLADAGSYAHATNHAAHVYNFASYLNLSKEETTDAYYAALLHDIGKLYYQHIVKLPRKLSHEEKKELDNHSILSYLILSSCRYSDIVRYSGLFHHYNHETQFGYPKIDSSLTSTINEIATKFNLAIPNELTTDFSHISQSQWKILHMVTLLDSLDAAIDPNRNYKSVINLDMVKENFETHECNWNTLFDKSLQNSFLEYIEWLQEQVSVMS